MVRVRQPKPAEYSRVLDVAVAEGAISTEDRVALADLSPVEGVAEIRTRQAAQRATTSMGSDTAVVSRPVRESSSSSFVPFRDEGD